MGIAQRRQQPTAARNLLCHCGKGNWRTATRVRAPARQPAPPGEPQIRARGRRHGTGNGEGRGCGRQSRMSGERHAVCARRVVVRRPKGVGRGVAAPHEVGTDTRNEYRKIVAESRWWHEPKPAFYSNECRGERDRQQIGRRKRNNIDGPGPGGIFGAVSCSTEARLRHNNDISQYNEYTLVLRYNILLCPSRAEDVQHSKEAKQRVRSGIEGRQDQEESGIVVHSAARHRSMLCRSTTYRARSAAATRMWR